LPEDLVVFCCLNSPWKIDPETFKCWMTILHRVPESVLWLYDDTMHSSDRLCREALIAGIDPSRLIFAIRLPHAEHLARFHCADVFLDTFSCNAHTTCVEAMTAGLPVVTLPGDTVVQRVASSLLTAHGFTELIASNSDVYVELACRLALDRPWRKQLRKEFEHTAGSALFCTERRVREIERAFEMMWKRHSLGLPPADFDVPPLDD
jgi:predicted O-linked N-acetylglucosamine transferase (SPINDLY family)